MAPEQLVWDVRLPEKGAQRPRATLTISTPTNGDEELRVPTAVGKKLLARREDGATTPYSRAELLYDIGELARSCGRLRVEALLNRRDYSSLELSEKLRLDGYSSKTVEELVDRAVECGLVDDARYGASYARSKVSCGWGRIRIERELRRRGVMPEDIPGWPDDFLTAEDERDRAIALASRRRLTGKNDYEKTVRFLCGRGFSPSLAIEVARLVTHGDD